MTTRQSIAFLIHDNAEYIFEMEKASDRESFIEIVSNYFETQEEQEIAASLAANAFDFEYNQMQHEFGVMSFPDVACMILLDDCTSFSAEDVKRHAAMSLTDVACEDGVNVEIADMTATPVSSPFGTQYRVCGTVNQFKRFQN